MKIDLSIGGFASASEYEEFKLIAANPRGSMRTERTETGFIQNYGGEVFSSIECNIKTGECRLLFRDGRQTIFQTHGSVFNAQYGIPVSENHLRIFVTNWEKGLYCYDAVTGKELWHFSGTQFTSVIAYPFYLVVCKSGSSILKIDIADGKTLGSVSSRSIEHIFYLNAPLIFADKIGRSCCLFDTESFEIKKKYSAKAVNPSNCLSQIIMSVYVENNELVIEGFEEYADRKFGDNDKVTFSRIIDNWALSPPQQH